MEMSSHLYKLNGLNTHICAWHIVHCLAWHVQLLVQRCGVPAAQNIKRCAEVDWAQCLPNRLDIAHAFWLCHLGLRASLRCACTPAACALPIRFSSFVSSTSTSLWFGGAGRACDAATTVITAAGERDGAPCIEH